jgi:two-component system, probable response regulator PhcQ
MGHKVLIVDDEPNILEGLRRALHREPYEILGAEAAESAIQILRRNVIAVVISDQQMPGMNGIEFLKQVRERFPTTTRMMMTGNATLEVAADAINEGSVERFFIKPVHPIDVALAIRRALKDRDLLVRLHRLMRQRKSDRQALQQLAQTHPEVREALRQTKQDSIPSDEPTGTLDEVLLELDAEAGAPQQ